MTEPDPRPGTRSEQIIALRSASFGYADRTVVSGADLTVRRGEVVALLGPNGCGKSTLVKGLLGLNEHQGGEVDLFGTPLARFHRRYLLGYVPQRHTLSSAVAATVTEVVAAGRLPHQGLFARLGREDRAIIAESLELVGLADRARDDVADLSGGQQRRVLIARALAARPEVLVMDEPTAGVDVGNQRALEAVLARLADRGTTMLIVTHEVAPLRALLTRMVTMSAGRITFDGPASRLDAAGDLTGDWVSHHETGDRHPHVGVHGAGLTGVHGGAHGEAHGEAHRGRNGGGHGAGHGDAEVGGQAGGHGGRITHPLGEGPRHEHHHEHAHHDAEFDAPPPALGLAPPLSAHRAPRSRPTDRGDDRA